MSPWTWRLLRVDTGEGDLHTEAKASLKGVLRAGLHGIIAEIDRHYVWCVAGTIGVVEALKNNVSPL